MARKNPVPEREIRIGERLAEAREGALVDRSALARNIGVARESLITYETGRVPLKFWPGVKACKALKLNQAWLATGSGPMHPYIEFNWEIAAKIVPAAAMFSTGYDSFLAAEVGHKSLMVQAKNEVKWGAETTFYEMYLAASAGWFNRVQRGYEGEFVLRLGKAAEKIIADLGRKPVKNRLAVASLLTDMIMASGGVDKFMAKHRKASRR